MTYYPNIAVFDNDEYRLVTNVRLKNSDGLYYTVVVRSSMAYHETNIPKHLMVTEVWRRFIKSVQYVQQHHQFNPDDLKLNPIDPYQGPLNMESEPVNYLKYYGEGITYDQILELNFPNNGIKI